MGALGAFPSIVCQRCLTPVSVCEVCEAAGRFPFRCEEPRCLPLHNHYLERKAQSALRGSVIYESNNSPPIGG